MQYHSYESVNYRKSRRNRASERAIVAAGVCAFISSYFANLATTNTFSIQAVYMAPIMVALYLLLYWIYGRCYDVIMRSASLSRMLFGGLHREDVTHIIAEDIPSDLSKLLGDFCEDPPKKKLLIVKALYEIENMLDFLNTYSGSVYLLGPQNRMQVGRAPAFVSITTIKAIFENIDNVICLCSKENEDEIKMLCQSLRKCNQDVFEKYKRKAK